MHPCMIFVMVRRPSSSSPALVDNKAIAELNSDRQLRLTYYRPQLPILSQDIYCELGSALW